MNSITTMDRVVGEIDRLVAGITDEQLADKTPCAEWTVKDLLAHVIGGAELFAAVFNGDQPSMEPPALPDDAGAIRGQWAAGRDRVMASLGLPGVLDRTATFPWGDMPGSAAVDLAVFDVTTHAADLATATGQPMPPDELLVTALAAGKQLVPPEMRVPGLFDPEQPVADDAPAATKLLAFAGRRV